MTTAINASGTAANTSGDIALLDNASTVLHLSAPAVGGAVALPQDAMAVVQVKDTAGAYMDIATLDVKNPIAQFFGPATYRVRKSASTNPFSVERD